MSRAIAPVLAAFWAFALLGWMWPDAAVGPALLAGWLVTTGPGLAGATALLLAAWGPGAWLAGWLSPRALDDGASQALLDVSCGVVLMQGLAVLLGSFSALGAYLGPAWVAAGLVAGVVRVARHGAPRLPLRAGPLSWAAAAVAVGLVLPTLLAIGAPPSAADELQYHLQLPAAMLSSGGFATDPQAPASAFPRGMHVLLVYALGMGGQPTARPLMLLLGLLALVSGQRLASRLGGAGAGAISLLVLVGAPTVVRSLPVVSSDLPMGLLLGVALLLLVESIESPDGITARLLLLLGILAGAAFSMKYTAALFFAPVYLGFAWRAHATRAPRAPIVAALAGAALLPLLFAMPWFVSNVAAGVHPLYPIAGIDAPNGLAPAFRFNQTENYGAGGGWIAWLRSPWDLFALGTEFDRRHFLGRLGPWPLLAFPGMLLAARAPATRLTLLVALGGFALWAGPLRRVAYLMPLWPVIGALSAVGFAHLVRGRPTLTAWMTALVASIAVAEVAPAWSDHLADSDVATGQSDWESNLAVRAESSAAWAWVRENVPPSDVVATAFVWQVLAPDHRVIWTCAEECPTVRLNLLLAGSGARAAESLSAQGARWIVVKQQPFLRGSYPGLTDAQFVSGYREPLRVLDELTSLHGRRRFQSGRYTIFELSPPEK